MPVAIRKLSLEEVQRAFPSRGQQDLSEYVDALRDLEPGQAAGIDRQGLSDRVIKQRLGQAAKDLGYRLRWSKPRRRCCTSRSWGTLRPSRPMADSSADHGRPNLRRRRTWQPHPGGVAALHAPHRRHRTLVPGRRCATRACGAARSGSWRQAATGGSC